jgi:putative multiple sugar transport system substrate-binding protein
MKNFAKAAVVLAAAGALALTGCGGGRAAETPAASGSGSGAAAGFAKDAVIGVALPQKTSENWVIAEGLFNEGLKAAGFTPMVEFANGGVTEQQNQIQAMIEKGAKVIAVGAIDGSQLGTQLADAKAKGITIIAYERLLTNTKDVDFYVTFDNFKIGQMQGQALLDGLAKRKGDKKKWNIEIIAGSADDNNATVFYKGAMDVLQPKIDDGTLTVLSKQTTFQQTTTPGWKAENAQKRMDTLLSGFYQKAELDGILSPNDTLARAAMAAVDAANKPLPVVTGQDSEVESVKSVVAGKQYSTIFKDTHVVVGKTIEFIQDLQQGKPLVPNDTKSYNNGVITVPSYLNTPVSVTQENAAEAYANDKTLGPIAKG